MLMRLTIYLTEDEYRALQKQAERDVRGLREEARYLVLLGLRQRSSLRVGPAIDPVGEVERLSETEC